MRRGVLLVVPFLVGELLACSTTQYVPQVVARGEITLRYQGAYEMWAEGRKIAGGLGWKGLPAYVRCVPKAHEHADGAVRDGARAVALSVIGGIMGVAATGALIGAAADRNESHLLPWLLGGVGVAVIGTVFAGLGRMHRNNANGHAVDAMNYYNDAVGSLGATCDDLVYPPPCALVSPLETPAPPPAPPVSPTETPPPREPAPAPSPSSTAATRPTG